MNRINWTQVAVFGGVVLLVFLIGISLLSFSGQGYGYGGWGPGGMMGPGMMGGRGPGMMGYSYGGGALGWLSSLLGLIFPLGFLALLILGGVWLVRQVSQPQVPSAGRPQAQQGQTCPGCDLTVQADWQLCPYCGQGLV
jgi:hypothetical protein